MTNDEIVVLSNEIEINWGLFKSNAKGKKLDEAKIGFIELNNMADEIGFELVGEYIGTMEKTIFQSRYNNEIKLFMSPNKFKRYTYKRTKEFLNKLEINKDKFIKWIGFIDKKGLIAEIKTFDNETVNITIGGYNSFVKSREGYYKVVSEKNEKAISGYVNSKTKVEMICKEGHNFSITPSDYKNSCGCPKCASVCPIQAKEDLLKLIEENGHKLLSEYVNYSTKVLIDFNCGHKPHMTTPNNYKSGYGCPICKASKGEKEVVRILKEMNINYQEQYKFEGCRNIFPLPFDFYIPELNLCIEYDGLYHYEPVVYYKKEESEYKKAKAKKEAEERLEETKRRDKIKTDYCRDNRINLIRIPYWEFDNIEKILKKELSKYIQAVA